MALTANQRSKIVDRLVTNCSCQVGKTKVPFYSDEDRGTLNEMSDEQLITMDKVRETISNNALVANAAVSGFKHGDKQFKFDVNKGKFVANACGGGMAHEEEEEEAPEEEAAPEEEEEEKPVGNRRKQLTEKEFLQMAPPSMRNLLINAKRNEVKQRAALIEVITANENNEFSEDHLARKDINELRAIAKLAQNVRMSDVDDDYTDFSGAAGGVSNEAMGDDAILAPTPTINWGELSDEHASAGRKRSKK